MLRIKSLRTKNNFSQRALAERIGSSQKAVDYWEKEKSEPTAKFICALADCFGCSADYLLGREDDFGNVNVNSDLTERENLLLSVYRRLNENGKDHAVRFWEYLLSQEDFR